MTYTLPFWDESQYDYQNYRMFIHLLYAHHGIVIEDREKFLTETELFVTQPLGDRHIADLDCDLAVEYLSSKSSGKKTLIFFGCDETSMGFAFKKVQQLAERLQSCYEHFVYLIDDLEGNITYDNWCKQHNKQPIITVFSGIHLALHWVSDELLDSYENIRPVTAKNRPFYFVSYNGVARLHRLQLLGYLLQQNLLDKGVCSFFVNNLELDELKDCAPNYPQLWDVISNWDKLPIQLDDSFEKHHNLGIHDSRNSSTCALNLDKLQHREISYFTVLTETVYYLKSALENDNHDILSTKNFTEKTFHTMRMQQPFVFIGHCGALKMLRSKGFKTFDQWWDESYDDIEDDYQRLLAVFDVIKTLCEKSKQEWDSMYTEIQSVLTHNAELLAQPVLDFSTSPGKQKLIEIFGT